MTSRALRRRLHHGDVDGKRHEHLETSGLDGLRGNTTIGHLLFSQLIAHWAQWLANLVVGSGTLIGRLLSFPSATQNGQTKKLLVPSLSPLQVKHKDYHFIGNEMNA
ncbi:hypothetical protein CsSME_00036010 [Camellia sinensis var. sinensis]